MGVCVQGTQTLECSGWIVDPTTARIRCLEVWASQFQKRMSTIVLRAQRRSFCLGIVGCGSLEVLELMCKFGVWGSRLEV